MHDLIKAAIAAMVHSHTSDLNTLKSLGLAKSYIGLWPTNAELPALINGIMLSYNLTLLNSCFNLKDMPEEEYKQMLKDMAELYQSGMEAAIAKGKPPLSDMKTYTSDGEEVVVPEVVH